jgi:Fe-S-cluster containining protein
VLFDHCAKCQRCCNVESGYPPLEITLTQREEKRLGSICIQIKCDHLGNQGCTLGDDKPFGCTLYPLSYNPQKQNFYFDADCPLMDVYIQGLADSQSEASAHLAKVSAGVAKLEKTDPVFLQQNFEVDKAYFDLKKITPTKTKTKSKKSLHKATQ